MVDWVAFYDCSGQAGWAMKIYCSGIGGIGLSAYAALQSANGHEVSGSDRHETALTNELTAQGVSVFYEQDGSHVPTDADVFVYSEAVPPSAPERLVADEYGIRSVNYFEALGELSKNYNVIAVCGTHGKSSTTAMAAKVLVDAGLEPTVVVGTKVPQLNGKNWRKGTSNLFLLEACEYRGSFLHLHPNVVLILNVDGDHFDAFDSVEQYQEYFAKFLQRLPDDGVVITHGNDADCVRLATESHRTVINADRYELPELSVPGLHMQQNAQLVLALADHLHISANQSLKEFAGTWRRMEIKGETTNGVLVIDDYAHHPKEIEATTQAIKQAYPNRRLVAVFQPHMHDRTSKLYDEFTQAFSAVDSVVLTDVYDARPDVETGRVSMKKFAADIPVNTVYAGDLEATTTLLTEQVLQSGDVVLIMGAGTVTRLSTRLFEE